MPSRPARRATGCAAAVLTTAAIAGCATAPAERDGDPLAAATAPMPAGQCVTLHGDGHDEALTAVATGCGNGMTYTVAAHTDATGDCPSPRDTTVFVEPFADRPTARLCLVPNLAVGQCYAFGLPTGIYAEAGCADAEVASIRIEERFEISDADCTDPRPGRAMVFQSVPRTYCLSYPGIDR